MPSLTPTVCIVTQSHLCRNPRVVKEANALVQAGNQVTVLTHFTSARLLAEDRLLIDPRVHYRAPVNLIVGQASQFYRFRTRLQWRLAVETVKRLGIPSPHALGYDYLAMLSAAKRLRAQLYICHQEQGSLVGYRLLQTGFPVAFDFEDWYSRDLPPEARKSRPLALLEQIERNALLRARYVTTTSHAMATALAETYGAPRPHVVYNAFRWSDRSQLDGLNRDRPEREKISLFWFSQTIGPDRGLELLCAALHHVPQSIRLHLRGDCAEAYRHALRQRVPAWHSAYFHPMVSPSELLSRIAEHDIGLALESRESESRDCTVTNKILHYLLAGIPVIATDTQGQREVAQAAPEAVVVFTDGNEKELAVAINHWAQNPDRLANARRKALQASEEEFCWERQEPHLLALVAEATNQPHPRKS